LLLGEAERAAGLGSRGKALFQRCAARTDQQEEEVGFKRNCLFYGETDHFLTFPKPFSKSKKKLREIASEIHPVLSILQIYLRKWDKLFFSLLQISYLYFCGNKCLKPLGKS
jgi:hypothetical protein